MRLTDLAIQKLPTPEQGAKTYFDDAVRGLGIRVSSGGAKSFTLLHGKSRTRTPIGRYPIISLAEARAAARRILAETTLGRHIRPTKGVQEAVNGFLAHVQTNNRPRTYLDYKRHLERHLLPRFKRNKLGDVSTQAIADRLDALGKTPGEQNHAFAVFRAFFRWCVRKGYLDRSPMAGMQSTSRSTNRARVLDDHELAAVYRTAIVGKTSFHHIVALCVLTGLRRGEVAALEHSWIKNDHLDIPASAVKNNRPFSPPLSRLAKRALAAVPRFSDVYVFPAARSRTQNKPATIFNGWGKPKERFDRELAEAAYEIEPWTLHDLRRTFATNLQRLGVRIEVIEALLNHISGTRAGIVGVYQRYDYGPEMTAALKKHDAFLTKLTNELN